MRRVAGNMLAMVTASIVSLVIGELTLRPYVPLPLPRIEPEVKYDAHPVRRFTLRPGQRAYTYGAPAIIDEQGFRSTGGSVPAKPGATVFALGDSFTFGLGVRDEETWPAQLEAALRQQARPEVRVINGGTISYGAFQELDLLRDTALATRPALVIHGLFWNDFMNPEAPPPDAPSVITPDGRFVWDPAGDDRGAVRRWLSTMVESSSLLFAARQAASRYERRGSTEHLRANSRMLEGGLSNEEW